jgi:hypothetical protein
MGEAVSSLQEPLNRCPDPHSPCGGSTQVRNQLPSTSKVEKWAVGVFAVLVWMLILLCSCCWDRTPAFDEIGLHNPVYMYLHYGKMTYPAHGQFDHMVVHPPLHYTMIAWLMKLGVPLFHAAGLPLCVLSLICFFLIWQGRFPGPVKLGLMAGLLLAVFVWNWLITLRPESHLAVAWFTGLVALESSRLEGWKPSRRPFLGGFLLAYASGIHYIGAAIWVGLIVYGLWCLRDLGWRGARRPVVFMLAGACLFGLPYFYFWVYPSWNAIQQMTKVVQGEGGISQALNCYWKAYAAWKHDYEGGLGYGRITTLVTTPPIYLGFPAAIIATGMLLILPSTRGLALAGLPHLLFIMLHVRGGLKTSTYTGYYVPEFIAYLCGSFVLALALLNWLLRKVLPNIFQALVVPTLAVVLAVILSRDLGHTTFQFTPRLDDFDIARAAGRQIVGPDANIGIVSAGVWYANGGSNVCFITEDFIYPPDISSLDLRRYFRHYDSLLLYPHMSEVTYNQQRKTLSSCFADGTLDLKGFYFSDRRAWHECDMAYLAVAVQKQPERIGFGYHHGALFRFQERPDGQDLFACYVCPVNQLSNKDLGDLDFYVTFRLPMDEPTEPPDRMLCAFIMPRERYKQIKPELLSKARLREEFPVLRSREKSEEMLRQLRREDKPIRFFQCLAQLELYLTSQRATRAQTGLLKASVSDRR